MKYLLVCVKEREIQTPELFDNREAAHFAMLEQLSQVLGENYQTVVDWFIQGAQAQPQDTGITANAAWTEKHGENFDWKIFTVKKNGDISPCTEGEE